jgi:4'-phosphopantetheinyl transferase
MPRVVVRWSAVTAVDPDLAWSILSDAERRRAERTGHAAVRRRFVTGRALLRSLVAETLPTSAVEVRIDQEPLGRPWLPDHPETGVSVSATHDRVVVAVAVGTSHLGVDVERLDRPLHIPAGRWCTPTEVVALERLTDRDRRRRHLELWTGKEAVTKALGTGLRRPLRDVEVLPDTRADGVPPGVLRWVDAGPDHLVAVAAWA